jgi:WD40 repeat protein
MGWAFGRFGTASPCARKITTHAGSVRAVAWSPDAAVIVTGSTDETIRYHAEMGYLELRAHQFRMRCAALSNDGQLLALGSVARTVTLLNLKQGTHQWSFEGTSEVVTPAGWDFGKGPRLLAKRREGLDEYARCVAFSRSGKFIAVGCDDRTVRILDVATGRCDEPVLAHSHPDPVHCLAWSPDDRHVLSCSDNVVAMWDRSTPRAKTSHAHRGRILAAAWAPSGNVFATTGEDRSILLWQDFNPRDLCVSPKEMVLLSWSPDGKFILGAGMCDQAFVWNAQYGQMVAQVPTVGGVSALTWSASHCLLALDRGEVLVVEQGTWQSKDRISSLPSTHRSLCLRIVDSPIESDAVAVPELLFATRRIGEQVSNRIGNLTGTV